MGVQNGMGETASHHENTYQFTLRFLRSVLSLQVLKALLSFLVFVHDVLK